MDKKVIITSIISAFIGVFVTFIVQRSTNFIDLLIDQSIKDEIAATVSDKLFSDEVFIGKIVAKSVNEFNSNIRIATGKYSTSDKSFNEKNHGISISKDREKGFFTIVFDEIFDGVPNIHITPIHGFGNSVTAHNWLISTSIAEIKDPRTMRIKITLSQSNFIDPEVNNEVEKISLDGYDTDFMITAIYSRL